MSLLPLSLLASNLYDQVSTPEASYTQAIRPPRMPRVRLPPVRPIFGVSSSSSTSANRLHFPPSSPSRHSTSDFCAETPESITPSRLSTSHLERGAASLESSGQDDGVRRSPLLPNPLTHLDISIGGRDAGRMVFQVNLLSGDNAPNRDKKALLQTVLLTRVGRHISL